ncbi:PAS domain S-box protein [Pararhodonellum marinum]|uniref:PAS domain S-box protein n=1 Tax=Pararhodonellum marinum TaxID=2755358 RepID=UPI00188ED851|nr:PAS domain S-box protein [Pararhodonellum marinum]
MGEGEKVGAPLVIDRHIFQMVQIEGYTIAQDDQNYLVNILISSVSKEEESKLCWLYHIRKGLIFNSSDNHIKENFKHVSQLKQYLIERFKFLEEEQLDDFLKDSEVKEFPLFEKYLVLRKEIINNGYVLLAMTYVSQPEIFSGDREVLIKEQSGAMFYEHELGSNLMHWSGAIQQVLGYKAADWKVSTLEDWKALIHPLDLDQFLLGGGKDISERLTFDTTYRLRHKSGHYIYVQDMARIYQQPDMILPLVMGTIKDVSRIKAVEEDLYENQSKLQELTKVVPGMVYMLKKLPDQTEQFLFVSDGSKSLFELNPNELIEHSDLILKMMLKEDVSHYLSASKLATEKNEKFENYFRVKTPSGEIKWIYGASNRLNQYKRDSIWTGFFVDVSYTKEKEEEAQEHFLKYKSIFDNNPQSIVHFNREGIVLDVNATFLKKIGIPDENLILGNNFLELLGDHPVMEAVQKCFATGFGFYEGPYTTFFSKKSFFVRVTFSAMNDNSTFQAIAEDITEEYFVQSLLNKISEKSAKFHDQDFFNELVKLLSKNMQIPMCFIGRFDAHKKTIKTISFVSNGELVPEVEFPVRDSPFEMLLHESQFNVQNIPYNAWRLFPKPDFLHDSEIESVVSVTFRDRRGKKIGLLALMNKKTMPLETSLTPLMRIIGDRVGAELQRMIFEQDLVNSEQLFRSIAENFPNGTVDVLDKNLRYIYTDGREYAKLKIDGQKFIGTKHLDKYSAEVTKVAKSQLRKLLKGESVQYEIEFMGYNYLNSGVPLLNQKGEIERFLIVTQNITDTKKAGVEREKLIADLKHQNEEMQRFTYIVSHNLRAPIVNITSLIDLYNYQYPADHENEEVMENLRISTTLLNETLQDLIEVVSVKKEKIPKVERLEFRTILSNIEISLKKQINDARVTIIKDFESAPYINYIHAHLDNFFLNFMTNAIKYKHPERDPVIHIRTSRKRGFTVIEFQDNGIGIDMEKFGGRLFGLYQRFHSHVEGKGLGLYLVNEQIRSNGGRMEVVSEVDKGTKFVVYLKQMKVTIPSKVH